MEKNNRLWELLGKKTSGEATEKEKQELEKMLKGKEGNVQYMMSVMDHYWDAVQQAAETDKGPQIPRRLRKYDLPKTASGQYLISPYKMRYRRRKVLLIAAAIALLLSGSWMAWHSIFIQDNEMNVVSTRNGSKTKVTLPDGTQVWLNADSKITYPNDFQHIENREITLAGEAFFEVKHDADRPFIIHTKYLDIKDIGTEFNVKAYPDDSLSEAALISGSIAVSLRNDPEHSIILNPKEKVVYVMKPDGFPLKTNTHKSDTQCIKPLEKNDPASRIKVTPFTSIASPSGDSIVTETAWMHNQLAFEGEKFDQLAKRMERWYNVKFEINSKKVANYSFTGIFEGETVEQALKELQMIRPFQFSISKDEVVISD